MQRGMMNPTNGGAVKTKVDVANTKRIARLADMKRSDPERFNTLLASPESKVATLSELTLEDVTDPPRVSLESFWDMVEAEYSDLHELLGVLRTIQDRVVYVREHGLPPMDVRYNFMLQGPPGTG